MLLAITCDSGGREGRIVVIGSEYDYFIADHPEQFSALEVAETLVRLHERQISDLTGELGDIWRALATAQKIIEELKPNVVNDLDMAVLKACANLDQERLEHQQGNDGCYYSDELGLVDAELARRKAAK